MLFVWLPTCVTHGICISFADAGAFPVWTCNNCMGFELEVPLPQAALTTNTFFKISGEMPVKQSNWVSRLAKTQKEFCVRSRRPASKHGGKVSMLDWNQNLAQFSVFQCLAMFWKVGTKMLHHSVPSCQFHLWLMPQLPKITKIRTCQILGSLCTLNAFACRTWRAEFCRFPLLPWNSLHQDIIDRHKNICKTKASDWEAIMTIVLDLHQFLRCFRTQQGTGRAEAVWQIREPWTTMPLIAMTLAPLRETVRCLCGQCANNLCGFLWTRPKGHRFHNFHLNHDSTKMHNARYATTTCCDQSYSTVPTVEWEYFETLDRTEERRKRLRGDWIVGIYRCWICISPIFRRPNPA